MRFQPDKKQRRQLAYRKRARSAFFAAKLMIPLVFVGASAAAWSDPVLGPRLETGLNEVRPMVEAVMEGAPLMDVLAEALQGNAAPGAPAADTAAAEELRSASAEGLPASAVPVNRPASETPVQE